MAALQESILKVQQQEEVRIIVIREILSTSTDFLRVTVDLGEGQGIILTYICLLFLRFPPEDHTWFVTQGHGDSGTNKKKQCGW